MKTATNCESLRDLREYISKEIPYVDYCIIEIDTTDYDDDSADVQTSEEIPIPISQGMRSYLIDWCDDILEDEGDIGLFEVDAALLHDLQYIADRSNVPYDWKDLRKRLKPYLAKRIHLILN